LGFWISSTLSFVYTRLVQKHGGHIFALELSSSSSDPQVRESVRRTICEVIIFPTRILQSFVEVPSRSDPGAGYRAVNGAVFVPRERFSLRSCFWRMDIPATTPTAPDHLLHQSIFMLQEVVHGLPLHFHTGDRLGLHLTQTLVSVINLRLQSTN
jgi:hypothetical protein